MANIVIIGGGVAGLSAGIYAQMMGQSAIICERHTRAGGNLTGWKRGGYVIDNCIHWLTGTNPNTDTYKMWCELGALGENVGVYYGDSLFTVSRAGESVSLYCDLERTRRSMIKVSKEDEKETEDFILAVRAMIGLMGLDEEKGSKRSALYVGRLAKYYFLSTGDLAKRFKNPLLRDLVCGVMGESFGSLALICVFATYCGKNGGIPQGGSIAMAERMRERFLSLGGQLLLNSEVVGIEKRNGIAESVSLSDGRRIKADYVIFSCDPAESFKKLLGCEVPRALKRQYESQRMMRFSSLHTAFACDLEKLPFEADHIFAISRRDQRKLGAKYLVLREFSHEPSFAPKGKNIIEALVFCDESEARRYIELSKDKEAYRAKKEELAREMMRLTEQKFPSLLSKLEILDVWTPATYKRYTDSEIGSYMSFILPSRMLPRRIKCKIDGYKNVILATQWQQSPGGLPIAAECGRAAAYMICRREEKIAQRNRSCGEVYKEEIRGGD